MTVAIEHVVNKWTGDETVHPLYREVVVWCPGCDQRHSLTVEVLDPEWKRPNGSAQPVWGWDGNLERPTFTPSLLCYSTIHLCEGEHTFTECADPDFEACGHRSHGYAWVDESGRGRTFKTWETKPEGVREILFGDSSEHPRKPAWGNCHSFIKDGRWEFLGDCAHALAGQTVDMVPLPQRVVDDGF